MTPQRWSRILRAQWSKEDFRNNERAPAVIRGRGCRIDSPRTGCPKCLGDRNQGGGESAFDSSAATGDVATFLRSGLPVMDDSCYTLPNLAGAAAVDCME